MQKSNIPNMRRLFWFLILIWSTFTIIVFFWNWHSNIEHYKAIALHQNRVAFQKDIIYRNWVASHGGVYVPVTKRTQPNPNLSHIKNRDITTQAGLKLTLVNPAYMTRQVFELSKKIEGPRTRIISLHPINPKNTPDEWEKKALIKLKKGEKEIFSFIEKGKSNFLRLVSPFVTKKRCLKCHTKHGHKTGDIQGGISITTQTDKLINTGRKHLLVENIALFFLWIAGIIMITYLIRRQKQKVLTIDDLDTVNKQLAVTNEKFETANEEFAETNEKLENTIKNLTKTQLELLNSEMRNRAIVTALPEIIFVIDSETRLIDYYVDDHDILMLPPKDFIGKKISEIFPPRIADLAETNIRKTFSNGEINIFNYSLDLKNGTFEYEAKIVNLGDNNVLAVIQDITKFKRAENAQLIEKNKLIDIIESMKVSLKEKELLLQKVHHKIKK